MNFENAHVALTHLQEELRSERNPGASLLYGLEVFSQHGALAALSALNAVSARTPSACRAYVLARDACSTAANCAA